MCIITGPNIDMAIKLLKRMKNIFETKLDLYVQNKETVLTLNGCNVAVVLAMMISKEYLCISKEYDKMFISLRTAYPNELSVDKERTSYSDSLDALSLACKMDKMK